jgi:hypothetical protein
MGLSWKLKERLTLAGEFAALLRNEFPTKACNIYIKVQVIIFNLEIKSFNISVQFT